MVKPSGLTTELLISKGYLHDRLIPPLDSSSLGEALDEIEPITESEDVSRSRCSLHSVPKRGHLRRILSIPNPFHQIKLSRLIEDNADLFLKAGRKSNISLSKPVVDESTALKSRHRLSQQPTKRISTSTSKRVLLRADITRFYPSIYTHSIAWALHGKEAARAKGSKSLPGNQLDRAICATQDKQTGGIPIGPATSYLVAEIMGAHIDQQLKKKVPKLRGTRFIDDFHLYFDSTAAAESALAGLNRAASSVGLEVNDLKTSISSLPEALEPLWKSELRAFFIHDSPKDHSKQAEDFLGFFNRAITLSQAFPEDSVLTYASRRVLEMFMHKKNWNLCQSFLLRAALSEPGIIEHIVKWPKSEEYTFAERALKSTIYSLCSYHAPLQQGYEVAWALWLAKHFKVKISMQAAKAIASCDDDVVALISLDLRNLGQFPTDVDLGLWESYMVADQLYSDHWLLCYEAANKGWFPPEDDYIAEDEFFLALRDNDVYFYDGEKAAAQESHAKYDDDDRSWIDELILEDENDDDIEAEPAK
jgi:hypothetical protein